MCVLRGVRLWYVGVQISVGELVEYIHVGISMSNGNGRNLSCRFFVDIDLNYKLHPDNREKSSLASLASCEPQVVLPDNAFNRELERYSIPVNIHR